MKTKATLRDWVFVSIMLLILALFAGSCVWYTTFRYSECRKVGHSALYCIDDVR